MKSREKKNEGCWRCYERLKLRRADQRERIANNEQYSVRIFTKANVSYCLAVRDGDVVLAPANPRDEYQHWFKDMSTRMKDKEGFPSFALINRATRQAINHSVGGANPVRLVHYKPDYVDASVLWTESKDTGEGFRCIRMVNDISLNLDAFRGNEKYGGVHDGTTVGLWECHKGNNQQWKIVPWAVYPPPQHLNLPGFEAGALTRNPTVKVFTHAGENYSLSIRDGNVVLVPSNPYDQYQHWIKDMGFSTKVKDEESIPSFALVNKVTRQALNHSNGAYHHVRLVPYNPNCLDKSVLWTESGNTGESFRYIRMVNNIHLNLDAFRGKVKWDNKNDVHDGTTVGLWKRHEGHNQMWKIIPY